MFYNSFHANFFEILILAPEDYLPLEDEVVTFLPGSTEECADLSIIDDDMVEPTETFLVLVSSLDAGVTITSPSQATVSILDNDQRECHYYYY